MRFRMSFRLLACATITLLAGQLSAQSPTMSSLSANSLADTERQLLPMITGRMRLISAARSMNFPFDFGTVYTFQVHAGLTENGICQVQLLSYYLVPTRHVMQEGPTYETAVRTMFDSPIRITSVFAGTAFALPDAAAPDCDTTIAANRQVDAENMEIARRGFQIMAGIGQRRQQDRASVTVDCRIAQGCEGLLDRLAAADVERIQPIGVPCAQHPLPSGERIAGPQPISSSAAPCYRFALRRDASEWLPSRIALVELSDENGTRITVRFFRLPPPPPV